MAERRDRINLAFNPHAPSLPGKGIAHVSRDSEHDRLRAACLSEGTTPIVYGPRGVGKTSLVGGVLGRLLGPERGLTSFSVLQITQASSFKQGLVATIKEAIPGLSEELLQSNSVSDDLLASWLDNASLLLQVENLQDLADEPECLATLIRFIKHLSDNAWRYPRTKVILVGALSSAAMNRLLNPGQNSITPIELPPWQDAELTAILDNGLEKAGLDIEPAASEHICALSCGIPQSLHLVAREALLTAVDQGFGARTRVLSTDLDLVVGEARPLAQICEQLRTGFQLRHVDALPVPELSLLAVCGRLRQPSSRADLASRLEGTPVDAVIASLVARDILVEDQQGFLWLADAAVGTLAMLSLRRRSPEVYARIVGMTPLDAPTPDSKAARPAEVPLGPASECRIVLFAANPGGTESAKLDVEVREIEQRLSQTGTVTLKTKWAVRTQDILPTLNEEQPHIVQFSGHGSPHEEIMLCGPDGKVTRVSNDALGSLFETLRDNIRLVVLNACYSAAQTETIVKHIDCAVGMSKVLGNRAAITFAASFYSAIGFGRSVKAAFDQGITALKLDGLSGQATPVLKTRSGVDPAEVYLVGKPKA